MWQRQRQSIAEWRPQLTFASVDSTSQEQQQQQQQSRTQSNIPTSDRSLNSSNATRDSINGNSNNNDGGVRTVGQPVTANGSSASEAEPDRDSDRDSHQASSPQSSPTTSVAERLSYSAQEPEPYPREPSDKPRRSWYRRLLALCGLRPNNTHDPAIWALAGPAVLALATDPLLGIVDTAFVGRLGPEELVRPIPLDRCMNVPSLWSHVGHVGGPQHLL